MNDREQTPGQQDTNGATLESSEPKLTLSVKRVRTHVRGGKGNPKPPGGSSGGGF